MGDAPLERRGEVGHHCPRLPRGVDYVGSVASADALVDVIAYRRSGADGREPNPAARDRALNDPLRKRLLGSISVDTICPVFHPVKECAVRGQLREGVQVGRRPKGVVAGAPDRACGTREAGNAARAADQRRVGRLHGQPASEQAAAGESRLMDCFVYQISFVLFNAPTMRTHSHTH
jgi:hypothetical protein